MITAMWLLTVIPLYVLRLPYTFKFIVMHIAGSAALCVTLLINRAGRYRSAQVWLSLVAFTIVTFNAVHFGHDTWNHLFLLAIILIAFNYIDSFAILVAVTIVGLALFIGIELLNATGFRSPLADKVDAGFFLFLTFVSIYNLVGLTIGIQYYN